ncbi:unnamed protein product [Ectocarpus sp. 4 AP-2014]
MDFSNRIMGRPMATMIPRVYMAPEVISGSHFPRTCDMWSIGVIAYLLLCGYPPFGGSSTAELKEQIQHGTYQFHHEAWSDISGRAKNFIKRLLVRNPQERMSAAEVYMHTITVSFTVSLGRPLPADAGLTCWALRFCHQ